MNWNNMFVAGGSVLASLIGHGAPSHKHTHSFRQQFTDCDTFGQFNALHDGRNLEHGFEDSDIDIFLYGLSSEAATAKVVELVDRLKQVNPHKMCFVRTKDAITIVSQWPFRPVQIVLRVYKSPAEVLMGFDLDCVTVGYNGTDVFALPRAVRALNGRFNLVDSERQSQTYEIRLYKYSKRGFAVLAPGLQRHRVHSSIYVKWFNELQGAAKLLMLERRKNKREAGIGLTVCSSHSNICGNPYSCLLHSWRVREFEKNTRNSFRSREIEALSGVHTSDYASVFLPYGPDWTASKVDKLLEKRRRGLWFGSSRQVPDYVFGFSLSDILDSHEDDDYFDWPPPRLPRFIEWLTLAPGRQFIGSFRPMQGDWYRDAYSGVGPALTEEQIEKRLNGRRQRRRWGWRHEGSGGAPPSSLPATTAPWACIVCTLVNEAGTSTCDVCASRPPPPSATAASGGSAAAAGGGGGFGPPPRLAVAVIEWRCEMCTFLNEAATTMCVACETLPPPAAVSAFKPTTTEPQQQQLPKKLSAPQCESQTQQSAAIGSEGNDAADELMVQAMHRLLTAGLAADCRLRLCNDGDERKKAVGDEWCDGGDGDGGALAHLAIVSVRCPALLIGADDDMPRDQPIEVTSFPGNINSLCFQWLLEYIYCDRVTFNSAFQRSPLNLLMLYRAAQRFRIERLSVLCLRAISALSPPEALPIASAVLAELGDGGITPCTAAAAATDAADVAIPAALDANDDGAGDAHDAGPPDASEENDDVSLPWDTALAFTLLPLLRDYRNDEARRYAAAYTATTTDDEGAIAAAVDAVLAPQPLLPLVVPPSTLLRDISSLLVADIGAGCGGSDSSSAVRERYADLTLVVAGNRRFPVHRAILCARSEALAGLLIVGGGGICKPNSTAEGCGTATALPEMAFGLPSTPPTAVFLFLRYVYTNLLPWSSPTTTISPTGDAPPPQHDAAPVSPSLLFGLFELADLYVLPRLASHCEDAMKHAMYAANHDYGSHSSGGYGVRLLCYVYDQPGRAPLLCRLISRVVAQMKRGIVLPGLAALASVPHVAPLLVEIARQAGGARQVTSRYNRGVASWGKGQNGGEQLLSVSMLQLLSGGAFSDLALQVGELSLPAHRAVLATRCPVLMPLLLGGGSGGSVLQMESVCADITPAALRLLLRFIYSGCLTDGDDAEAEGVSMSDLLATYSVAHQLRLQVLKDTVQARIFTTCNSLRDGFDLLFWVAPRVHAQRKPAAGGGDHRSGSGDGDGDDGDGVGDTPGSLLSLQSTEGVGASLYQPLLYFFLHKLPHMAKHTPFLASNASGVASCVDCRNRVDSDSTDKLSLFCLVEHPAIARSVVDMLRVGVQHGIFSSDEVDAEERRA